MTIEKPRPKNKIMASTFYALLAEFGTSQIPLEELCKKYFNLGIDAAKKKARNQSLPVPVLKMKDSNDGRYFVKAEILADYIDRLSEEAVREWESVNL